MGLFWDSDWARRIERKIDYLISKEGVDSVTLDELVTHVTDLQGVAESAESLLANLHQMLVDAINSGDPAKVQAIADQIDANKAALANAVAANQPPTP